MNKQGETVSNGLPDLGCVFSGPRAIAFASSVYRILTIHCGTPLCILTTPTLRPLGSFDVTEDGSFNATSIDMMT